MTGTHNHGDAGLSANAGHGSGQGGVDKRATAEQRRWLPAAVAAVLAAILLLVLVFQGGSDDEDVSAENSTEAVAGSDAEPSDGAAEEPNSDDVESEINDDAGYVDSDGVQEHEMEPAPGVYPGKDGMSITVAGQTAPIDPIQVTTEGFLIPPHDVSRVGWYSASAMPGSTESNGSTVITGHINFAEQGTGYADHFTRLKEGETFTITVDGEPREFRVTKAPFRVGKDQSMPDVVNATEGENQVVLITCGGEFVGGSLGYADNIFTVAEPA